MILAKIILKNQDFKCKKYMSNENNNFIGEYRKVCVNFKLLMIKF